MRSSLLSFPSGGAGVASASSLRSTVCKAESTSWDLLTSTGDSHTTWIVLPGNKTVKKHCPQPCFIKWGPGCPALAQWLQVCVYDHFYAGTSSRGSTHVLQGALTAAFSTAANSRPGRQNPPQEDTSLDRKCHLGTGPQSCSKHLPF